MPKLAMSFAGGFFMGLSVVLAIQRAPSAGGLAIAGSILSAVVYMKD